ncbi:hypothetical protein Droror1_Dr00025365, partial [Drosera rotundifolia]
MIEGINDCDNYYPYESKLNRIVQAYRGLVQDHLQELNSFINRELMASSAAETPQSMYDIPVK